VEILILIFYNGNFMAEKIMTNEEKPDEVIMETANPSYYPRIIGGSLEAGSSNSCIKYTSSDGLWIGNVNFSNAPFSVDNSGNIVITGNVIIGKLTGYHIQWDGTTLTIQARLQHCAGDILYKSADTSRLTINIYPNGLPVKQFTVFRGGTYRIKFDMINSN
jgi:hypothetical protein